jgi:hypothetical protein
MTITQDIIHYKTKVSHKHVVVIYHRNTPLPNVRKGLNGYTARRTRRLSRCRDQNITETLNWIAVKTLLLFTFRPLVRIAVIDRDPIICKIRPGLDRGKMPPS